MSRSISCILIIFFIANSSVFFYFFSSLTYIRYKIDLTNTKDDLFHITLFPGELNSENQYFNFVAFAPGVHQVLDYGRFVKSLTAYDERDSLIITEKISLNKWFISAPEKVYRIDYIIEDSFDAEVEEHAIYPMSGTGIEKDFIILNTFGVLGYFSGLLNKPIQIEINYNPEWKIGTALEKENGYYVADS